MLTLNLPLASLFGLHTPPRVALLLTLAFVVFLFRREIRGRPNVSGALWLPVLWLVLICSRSFTQWLITFALTVVAAVSLKGGSPVIACFIFPLLMAGVFFLLTRQVILADVILNNGWLIAFLAYCSFPSSGLISPWCLSSGGS